MEEGGHRWALGEILCGRCQNSVGKSLVPCGCPSSGQLEVLWDTGVVWSGCQGCSVLPGLMISFPSGKKKQRMWEMREDVDMQQE